ERGAERDRVLRAELEDVADLDRGLEAERAAADRAAVALLRDADVRDLRLEVAAVLDALEMPAGAVRARDELPLTKRLVEDDLALEADRPERARVGAERGADLVGRRRTDVVADHREQLRLLEAVVAADEREHDGPVGPRIRHRLRRRRVVDADQLG